MPVASHPVIRQVLTERLQGPETRRTLFERLEALLQRPVLAYFTSFAQPVMIQDQDVDLIEGVLQKLDLSNGLAILISSPGGFGLAAERLINVCRSYSGTKDYWAIVPSKAKSAATMFCFGASKILMSPTSEMGPVDPQLVYPRRARQLLTVFGLQLAEDLRRPLLKGRGREGQPRAIPPAVGTI